MNHVARRDVLGIIALAAVAVVPCANFQGEESGRASQATGATAFVGARLRCDEEKPVFLEKQDVVVDFDAVEYEFGDFSPRDGVLTLPFDGVYLVEAGVSLLNQSPKLVTGMDIRMVITCGGKPIAADSTTQLDQAPRSTCLSAGTTKLLEKGQEIRVRLLSRMKPDETTTWPTLAAERGVDTCHVSVTLVRRAQ